MVVYGPFTEYKFYNGDITLRYYHDPVHEYFKVENDGTLVKKVSVTTVCHIIDKSPALVPWAAKMMYEKLMRTLPTQTADDGLIMLEPMTLEEFHDIAIKAKDAHKDKLEDAGNTGHAAHAWLEKYIKISIGLIPSEFLPYPEDEKVKSCVQAALDWMRKHNVRWISTERKVYSREHGFAGTADGLAITDSCDDRKCCPKEFKNHKSLIDWKSSNYLYLEYLYQTAAYQEAIEEETGKKLDDRWVIRLGKTDGKFETWHLLEEDYESDWLGFKYCLELYQVHDKVNSRMKQRKAFVKEEYKRLKEITKIEERAAKQLVRETKKAEREAAKAEKLAKKKSKKVVDI